MRIVRIGVLGVLLLNATLVRATGSTADATASPTKGQGSPAAGTAGGAVGSAGNKITKEAVIGAWKSVDDGEVMDFAADGTARIKPPSAIFMGTYKLLDDGGLHLEVPAFGKQKDFLYQVELKGDQLTLTRKDKEAKPRTYERVK
jgi:hypothetical protein